MKVGVGAAVGKRGREGGKEGRAKVERIGRRRVGERQ